MKNTERFSNRAEKYVLYRPHYPLEIIPYLKTKINFTKEWVVADIGSGTGISAEQFVKHGNLVFGIEPNQKMRQAAESQFAENQNFISINSTAEKTTLKDSSVDLIISGQAFHWFDKTLSKKEFQRVAKLQAYLVLMWNERERESDFQKAYEQMLFQFAPAYEEVCQNQIKETEISTFFSPQLYEEKSFLNSQFLDLESLKGRLLSCSYAPLEDHPNYLAMIERLEKIFYQFNHHGKIEFKYDCKLFIGHLY